jgi:glycosyltransferase involved in cell wall biosynthesis
LGGEGDITKELIKEGIQYKIIKRYGKYSIRRLLSYKMFIHKNKFSVVISFNSVANNMTRLVKLIPPFDKFFHVAGERGRDFELVSIRNWINSKLSKLTNVIVCNSKIQREKLILTEKIKPEKVQVIYNGFDFDQLKNITPLDLYNEFGIPKGNRVICSVGNLSSPKNIPMFIDTGERILSTSDNISFLYVGDGPDLGRYKVLIQRKGISKKVFFVGPQDDILSILDACHLFILTSKQEGMPNVLIEAMAASVPVVSTKIDGVTEVITDGHNGFLVKSGDVNAMADKINQLMGDDALCELFRNNSFEIAKSMFDMDKMIVNYISLINNLLVIIVLHYRTVY